MNTAQDVSFLGWILLFPLIGFLVNGLWGRRLTATQAGTIASVGIGASFVLSVMGFLRLHGLESDARQLQQTLFDWINAGNLALPFTLRLDPLSSLLTLVVTGVGLLIHIYSIGYMSHDRRPGKFFAYLNLFTFAMLTLVLGASLPVMFLGWEGVGLCSYLLIGFWYEDPAKASAGKKAFIVNRIGDLGFLLGIFTLFALFGTLDFEEMKAAVLKGGETIDLAMLTMAAVCLFIGAVGKSAQFPLYIWLPDAMAGPTPVSALIHAATMVTAGVYMIVRMNFVFNLCPVVMLLIRDIGSFTAFFAATIAVVQTDIKKVLAYSTVSQLGYMVLAVGAGAYDAGVFHLTTHAFFKALLFLGAGSVIHGMHEEQNIMQMGGLKKHMPKTTMTFLIAVIAISGLPPFSGFFSKDEILWKVLSGVPGLSGKILWGMGMLTALMTAFYMTRLFCLVFLGQERFDVHHTHPHESPAVMTVPLMILAVLSIAGGFLGVPGHSWIEHWLSSVIVSHAEEAAEAHGSLEWVAMGASVAVAALGVWGGYVFYVKRRELPEKWATKLKNTMRILTHKYYVDEIAERIVIRPVARTAEMMWKFVDVVLVDGTVVGIGRLVAFTGNTVRALQTGALQVYAIFILIGMALALGYFIYGLPR